MTERSPHNPTGLCLLEWNQILLDGTQIGTDFILQSSSHTTDAQFVRPVRTLATFLDVIHPSRSKIYVAVRTRFLRCCPFTSLTDPQFIRNIYPMDGGFVDGTHASIPIVYNSITRHRTLLDFGTDTDGRVHVVRERGIHHHPDPDSSTNSATKYPWMLMVLHHHHRCSSVRPRSSDHYLN